jgi:2-phosphoglycerate kinase
VTHTKLPRGSSDFDSLRKRLRHVYWLGGGSGAGKSTIARHLTTKHSLRLYSTDDAMADHGRRYHPEDCPFLTAFKKMSMDERWVDRSPQTMFETFHWFRGEGFGLIIEDLLKLPPDEGVIAEGFRLLPQLVKPLLDRPGQAVWLIPTPEFRLAALESRGTLWSIAKKTSNPERALSNLLERDRLFTAYLLEMAEQTNVPTITVDSLVTESALENRVAAQFGLRRDPRRRGVH